MSDKEKKPPTPEEKLQKDLHEFLKDKFQLVMPVMGVPQGQSKAPEDDDGSEDERRKRVEALRFDLTPTEVKKHLDRFVIGQQDAKKTLAVAVCDHYNHVRHVHEQDLDAHSTQEYVKQNVILLGPTGVGKTYLIRTIAQLIGVPFVKADITKFSETGYVGGDVDDLVRELVRVADGDIELAQYGIVFLDEIDKIASSTNLIGKDVSGHGVQTGLLKLLEETEVAARSPNDISAQFQEIFQARSGKKTKRTINTRHVLFVVSGAFSGLKEIIERRLTQGNIGFTPTSAPSDGGDGDGVLAKVATQDFIDYGFEPEFIGRLPIRVALDSLSAADLYRILTTSEGSILKQHKENFRDYGIDVGFTDEALTTVAELAHAEKTGARGLMTILESRLRDFKFHLPGSAVKQFLVSPEVVEDPMEAVGELLESPEKDSEAVARLEVTQFGIDFEQRHGVRLDFDETAAAMAITLSRELRLGLFRYLDDTFSKHAELLLKIKEKSGRESLPVTPQILRNPVDGVDIWLRNDGEQETKNG